MDGIFSKMPVMSFNFLFLKPTQLLDMTLCVKGPTVFALPHGVAITTTTSEIGTK